MAPCEVAALAVACLGVPMAYLRPHVPLQYTRVPLLHLGEDVSEVVEGEESARVVHPAPHLPLEAREEELRRSKVHSEKKKKHLAFGTPRVCTGEQPLAPLP